MKGKEKERRIKYMFRIVVSYKIQCYAKCEKHFLSVCSADSALLVADTSYDKEYGQTL
jgi:hypothetical protein